MHTESMFGQSLNQPVFMSKYPALLGEGAWWDACLQRFVWIDIEGHTFFISTQDSVFQQDFKLSKRPGTIVPTQKGNFIIALEDSLILYKLKTKTIKRIARLQINTSELRFNDGKCDATGNLWIGTMDCKDYNKPVAKLYRITSEGIIEVKLTDITISNGLTWSIDNKTMYYIDSPTRTVKAFDFDLATGSITNGRVVIQTPDSLGTPDGCTIDSQGNLWVAQWGGACVIKWDPRSGSMLEKISVPALNVTSVALGGKLLNELYVTTASIGLDEAQKLKYPQAGHVFVYKVDVPGTPSFYWQEH